MKLGSSVHVVVVQRRQRNVQKSVMNEQSCCFANILKPIGFFVVLVAVVVVVAKTPYCNVGWEGGEEGVGWKLI